MAIDGNTTRAQLNNVIMGLYKATPSTLADGERDEVRLDSAGVLRVAPTGTSGVYAAASQTPYAAKVASYQGLAASTGRVLKGFFIKESAGTPGYAKIALHRGTLVGDPVIGFVNLAPGESDVRWFAPGGIEAAAGVFVEVVSGTHDLVLLY